MKKLLAAVIMVVLATPAFAAVQNVKVSGTITSAFVDRSDFNFKAPASTTYNQNFFYTSTHVLVSSDLSDNVSAQVGLVNEMPWGDQNVSESLSGGGSPTTGHDQGVDLELANLTLREFLYSPLSITIGRQTLAYGNDFLIGAGGGVSAGDLANVAGDISRTLNYDGIRAVLDYKPLTLDLVYAKTNSRTLTGGVGTSNTGIGKDDQNLYGAVANYQLGDAMSTVVEGSFWARTDDGNNTITGRKADTLYVPDLRVSTNPIKDLTLGLEAATQLGYHAIANNAVPIGTNGIVGQRSKVYGLQGKMAYTIPVLEKYKPTLTGTYTYVSGDNGKNGKDNAWDPMFNDQNLGTRIWRSMFGYSNLHIAELSLAVNPLEDVTAKLDWTGLWLASPAAGAGALNLPDGNAVTVVTTGKGSLGNEVDGELSYQYTEDVSFGLNLGLFKPGDAFDGRNNSIAKQAIASVGVAF